VWIIERTRKGDTREVKEMKSRRGKQTEKIDENSFENAAAKLLLVR
jgi:hypothetical protein